MRTRNPDEIFWIVFLGLPRTRDLIYPSAVWLKQLTTKPTTAMQCALQAEVFTAQLQGLNIYVTSPICYAAHTPTEEIKYNAPIICLGRMALLESQHMHPAPPF